MTVRYAYLKPAQGDSPFYVHVTLDGQARTLRLYWHMAWWKNEVVEAALFERWHQTFRSLLPRLERGKEKARKHSYQVQGRGHVSSALLRDVMGYVEPDTQAVLPAKLMGYVNAQNKIVEMEVVVPYRPLGSLPEEWLKLHHVFTVNPDYETVRPKLVFFDPSRVLRPGESSSSAADVPPTPPVVWPGHQGSPKVVPQSVSSEPTPPLDLSAAAAAAAQPDEIVADPTLDTWDGHPYGLPLVAEGAAEAETVVAAPVEPSS